MNENRLARISAEVHQLIASQEYSRAYALVGVYYARFVDEYPELLTLRHAIDVAYGSQSVVTILISCER